MITSQIPCPNCGAGTIHIVPAQLLTGAEFKCALCQTAVSLSPQSHSTLKNSLDTLEKLALGQSEKPQS